MLATSLLLIQIAQISGVEFSQLMAETDLIETTIEQVDYLTLQSFLTIKTTKLYRLTQLNTSYKSQFRLAFI